MSVINLGVIGAGAIAAQHLDVVTVLEGVTLAALSSRRLAAREGLGRQYGITRLYDSHLSLLDEPLDGVLVLVAPAAIADVTKECLERGIPTFLEKPPGLTWRQAESLAKLADRNRVRTQVGLNRRFYSVVKAARAAIEASGRFFGITVDAPENLSKAKAAGRSNEILRHWVVANSLHAIDLLRHIGGQIRIRHRSRGADLDSAETSLGALVEFDSGAIGQYTAHWGAPGGWSASLYGRGVQVVLSPFERGVLKHDDGREETLEPDLVDTQFKPGFYRQLEAFVSMLRSGSAGPPAADLADAARSVELAEWLAGASR